MYKSIFILIIGFSLLNFSCERSVSTNSQQASLIIPSPAPASGEDKNPKWRRHYWEALRLRLKGKPEEAIEEFKKSAELKDDKEVYREISDLYYGLKRYEEAEEYIRKVVERDPKDARAHWALAKLLVENLGRYDEGLKEALLSEELYGNDGFSHVRDRLIGQAYDGLGDYENAIKHYKIYLRGSSDAPDADDYKEIKKRVSELESRLK